MLHYAIVFLVLALIAGVLGFGGVVAISIDIARILFALFIVLFVISTVIHLLRGKTPKL